MTAVSMPGDASRTSGPDVLAVLRSRTGAGLIVATVLASMVTFLDANVVNVAIPAIGRDLGAGVAGVQWVLTGYLLTAAALLLPFGALADRFGRRRMLVIGLLVLLGGSVLCAVAPSVATLTVARVVQGVGAAMVVPNSLALLNGTLRMSDRAGDRHLGRVGHARDDRRSLCGRLAGRSRQLESDLPAQHPAHP